MIALTQARDSGVINDMTMLTSVKTGFQKSVKMAGIKFRVIKNGESNRRYLVIHGDEKTAKKVLRSHINTHSGTAFFVKSRKRHVRINFGRLDPNRMFSRVGAEKNLRKLNPRWSDKRLHKTLAYLDQDREAFLQAILPPPGGLIVALHNNWSGYSVQDEIPISDLVSLKDSDHPCDFLLCTDQSDFDLLTRAPYNAVLQKEAPPDDDGSLSRLAAKRGIRYINIEAHLGEFEKQKAMLEWLEENLP